MVLGEAGTEREHRLSPATCSHITSHIAQESGQVEAVRLAG